MIKAPKPIRIYHKTGFQRRTYMVYHDGAGTATIRKLRTDLGTTESEYSVNLNDCSCDCQGFQYHNTCSHLQICQGKYLGNEFEYPSAQYLVEEFTEFLRSKAKYKKAMPIGEIRNLSAKTIRRADIIATSDQFGWNAASIPVEMWGEWSGLTTRVFLVPDHAFSETYTKLIGNPNGNEEHRTANEIGSTGESTRDGSTDSQLRY